MHKYLSCVLYTFWDRCLNWAFFLNQYSKHEKFIVYQSALIFTLYVFLCLTHRRVTTGVNYGNSTVLLYSCESIVDLQSKDRMQSSSNPLIIGEDMMWLVNGWVRGTHEIDNILTVQMVELCPFNLLPVFAQTQGGKISKLNEWFFFPLFKSFLLWSSFHLFAESLDLSIYSQNRWKMHTDLKDLLALGSK